MTTAAVVPGPAEDANDTEGRAQSARPADDEQSAAEPAVNTSDLVALVIARLEIKSIADLAGRDVAIEEGQSASSGAIQTAIAASGAAEVQLSAGPAKAIDRLIDGEVPAAVLALVSTEAAEWFPEVPIIITKMGKEAARIVPPKKMTHSRLGFMKTPYYIPDNFDELPDDIARAFGMIE